MELITKLQENVTLETLYYLFAVLMCFDVTTGVIKAWKQGRFRSRTMRDGLFASMGELILLLLAILLSMLIPQSSFVVFALLAFMIIKELGSIFENLKQIGVKLPNWILKGLQMYTNELDDLKGGK